MASGDSASSLQSSTKGVDVILALCSPVSDKGMLAYHGVNMVAGGTVRVVSSV